MMTKKHILSAHHFTSDWDYYDQFLTLYEKRATDVLENGEVDVEIWEEMINDHYNEITEFLIDSDLAFLWLCRYYKEIQDAQEEP